MPDQTTLMARRLRQRMTRAERSLWKHLRADKLGFHFRRQHPLCGFVLDFYCPEAKLCVELDGEGHEKYHSEDDSKRDEHLLTFGIMTLRLKNEAAGVEIAQTIEQIRSLCISRTK